MGLVASLHFGKVDHHCSIASCLISYHRYFLSICRWLRREASSHLARSPSSTPVTPVAPQGHQAHVIAWLDHDTEMTPPSAVLCQSTMPSPLFRGACLK